MSCNECVGGKSELDILKNKIQSLPPNDYVIYKTENGRYEYCTAKQFYESAPGQAVEFVLQ